MSDASGVRGVPEKPRKETSMEKKKFPQTFTVATKRKRGWR
jgi:hypothetical protein